MIYLEDSDERPEQGVEILPLALLQDTSRKSLFDFAEFAPEKWHSEDAETVVNALLFFEKFHNKILHSLR